MARVCAVGNGPLSDADREAVAQCPFVVRFNDLKNMRPGERIDLHVLREAEGYYHGAGQCGQAPLLLVHNPPHGGAVPRAPRRRGAPVVGRLPHPPDLFGQPTDTHEWGATTGAVVLQHLQLSAGVGRVDVFGMNFTHADGSRHLRGEAELLRAADKLVIHPPPSSSYLP